MTEKQDWGCYLTNMNRLGLVPNFYCSKAYLYACKATLLEVEGWWIVKDVPNDIIMLPPIPMDRKNVGEPLPDYPIDIIWSDTPGMSHEVLAGIIQGNCLEPHFLDWQYVYDPKNFLKLEGGQWHTLRKNIRHARNEYPELYLVPFQGYLNQIKKLVGDWIVERKDTIQDAETIAEYLIFNPPDKCEIRALVDIHGNVKGVLAWDYNWKYINFRYCITESLPYLNEYARYLFYVSEEILKDGRKVNDGGIVDTPGLEFFKDRMNPYSKTPIHSWRKKV